MVLTWFMAVFILFTAAVLTSRPAHALTVQEVSHELACPCQCPLVLEDCNMSCGLDWKEDIGELIAKGMGKQEIIDHFIATHGDDAILTVRQRFEGKVYQYTRGFGTTQWAVLWSGIALWIAIMFFGLYMLVKKFTRTKKAIQE